MLNKIMKKSIWAGVLLIAGGLLWACGDEKSSSGTGEPSATPGAEFDATYKALFTTHCTGCHSAQDPFNTATFTSVRANRQKIITRIESTDSSKVMPVSPTTQWTNTDKARVLQYLKTSTDFN